PLIWAFCGTSPLTVIDGEFAFVAEAIGLAIPVVIDTDLGNNIDDAFALSLAAVSSEIELLGVTTTWYQAASRALIARRLLGAWGRTDVPVSVGHHPRYARESEQ